MVPPQSVRLRLILGKVFGSILVNGFKRKNMIQDALISNSGLPELTIGQQRIAVLPRPVEMVRSAMETDSHWGDMLIWEPGSDKPIRLLHI
jgi:hypothetical protein